MGTFNKEVIRLREEKKWEHKYLNEAMRLFKAIGSVRMP